jgi:glycosyltransferase involved in cell wall biosynthesis
VIAAYRAADLFVLASKIDPDGDRDGLPNVLMEAQSQALACIATTTGAIPELIVPDETGVLVPPGDIGALASAITALARDPGRRDAIGRAGARRVAGQFVFARNVGRIAARFGIGAPHHPRPAEQGLPEAACASPSMRR